jgi:hypothetical protein
MFHSSPESDLLKLLLQANHLPDQTGSAPYDWDPQSSETEAYLQSLEQAWPEDIVADYETIAPTLNKALDLTTNLTTVTAPTLKTMVIDRFPGIPQSIVDHILTQIKQSGLELLTLSDQLLHCIQDLFPGWAIEDLQVLARPYAYAFRSSSPSIPTTPMAERSSQGSPEAIEWNKLSDLEQIRLCFQLSKVALEAKTED